MRTLQLRTCTRGQIVADQSSTGCLQKPSARMIFIGWPHPAGHQGGNMSRSFRCCRSASREICADDVDSSEMIVLIYVEWSGLCGVWSTLFGCCDIVTYQDTRFFFFVVSVVVIALLWIDFLLLLLLHLFNQRTKST